MRSHAPRVGSNATVLECFQRSNDTVGTVLCLSHPTFRYFSLRQWSAAPLSAVRSEDDNANELPANWRWWCSGVLALGSMLRPRNRTSTTIIKGRCPRERLEACNSSGADHCRALSASRDQGRRRGLDLAGRATANSTSRKKALRKAGLLIGSVYRLRVTSIPLAEGLEVFPTIEVIDRLYAPLGPAAPLCRCPSN